ncbi:YphA family membrane protein [Aquibacillus rhizosphaerae]|uniref:Uncharacterized protein n=1 Tax=Aquibacillus rhizosphaerae TaxID=3051431 RepID=A0ABT7L4J3_9BACI|nr:hypothetical protein [Aquibacillus sp. LR5S19]MDL4840788.1 hypothetical protein [Aquibacillus sp. LR5S19]
MDGLFFYWMGWIIWILITFLMKKNRNRTILGLGILILILFSDTIITIGNLDVNVALILLYFAAMFVLASRKDWIINTIWSLAIVFGYAGILFWEQISPIWLFVPRTIIIPVIGFVFLSFLSRSFVVKCVIWCLGITTGEVIHGLILHSYGFSESIGELAFLDLVFIEIAFLLVNLFIKETRVRLDLFTQSIEKQRKRWTHE